MLPVTCVLTLEKAIAEHEVQIWNSRALNCMTFPYDLIKRRQPCYKAVSSVTFASVDFFGFLGDLQPLPQLPRGCKGPHKRGKREGMVVVVGWVCGGGWGGSLSLHSSCGSAQWRWRPHSKLQWPHGGQEVINEVRYSSWWRWSSQQRKTAV